MGNGNRKVSRSDSKSDCIPATSESCKARENLLKSNYVNETEIQTGTNLDEELSDQVLREKLLGVVRKHLFWSRRAVRRMNLKVSDKHSIYLYELKSQFERRQIVWEYEPMIKQSKTNASQFKDDSNPKILAQLTNSCDLHFSTVTIPPPDSLVCRFHGCWPQCSRSSVRRHSASSARSEQTLVMGSNPVNRHRRSSDTSSYSASQLSESLSDMTRSIAPSLFRSSRTNSVTSLNGASEALWSIDGPKSKIRGKSDHQSIKLDGTSCVRACHGCGGKGTFRCKVCKGDGNVGCLTCSGVGNITYLASVSRTNRSSIGSTCRPDGSEIGCENNSDDTCPTDSKRFKAPLRWSPASSPWLAEACQTCNGYGKMRCSDCHGRSRQTCRQCQGSGSLKYFLNLKIIRNDHCDRKIINNLEPKLTANLLQLCDSDTLLEDSGVRLIPLKMGSRKVEISGPNVDISELEGKIFETSRKLLEKHKRIYPEGLMLKQRHKLSRINCYIVKYDWKQKEGQFVIYGNDRSVYIDEYPFRGLCGMF